MGGIRELRSSLKRVLLVPQALVSLTIVHKLPWPQSPLQEAAAKPPPLSHPVAITARPQWVSPYKLPVPAPTQIASLVLVFSCFAE